MGVYAARKNVARISRSLSKNEKKKSENLKTGLMEDKIIRSPDCINGNSGHSVVSLDTNVITYECENCFERFHLISETAAKEAGLNLIPKP